MFHKLFIKFKAYNQTVRELRSLDDRALADLGITRAEIQEIAKKHARGLDGF